MTNGLKRLSGRLAYRREYGSLLKIGLPVLVTQLGIIVVSFADTMMVGAYGLDELASSAFVNSLFVIVVVMLIGFASGMTPLVGALYGRGEKREAGRTMAAGLQLNVVVALCFTAVMGGIYFLLGHFGQDEELLPLIRSYYLVVLCSLVPVAVFNCVQQTANATTDTATPMWIILGADALNVAGNYALIFGHWGFPEMGLLGAGISTLAARISAMVAILAVVRWRRRYRPYYEGAVEASGSRRELRRRIWQTSYPVMVQSGVECGLWTFGAVVSGWFGKVQLAAYQVVNTIAQLGFMIYMSFGISTSIRVANFTGQRDATAVRRVAKAGLRLNLLMATLSSAVFLLFTRDLVVMFTPEASVIAVAVTLVVPLVLYQYGDAVQITYANALRGTSRVKPLFWIAIVSYLLVGIPLLLLLAKGLGFEVVGVYYSFNGALVTASVLLYTAFRNTLRSQEREFAGASGAER